MITPIKTNNNAKPLFKGYIPPANAEIHYSPKYNLKDGLAYLIPDKDGLSTDEYVKYAQSQVKLANSALENAGGKSMILGEGERVVEKAL